MTVVVSCEENQFTMLELNACGEMSFQKFFQSTTIFLCTMEENGILDINNEIHISCLHYVFGKRINSDLNLWKNAYNMHPIRTEKICSPNQMWFNASMPVSYTHLTLPTILLV